jgi:hypothetical protein
MKNKINIYLKFILKVWERIKKMAQYGELLDTRNPGVDEVYKHFAEYYGNPTMIKIKDVDGYSMYMIKAYSFLNQEHRYLIALVTQDLNQPGQPQKLSNLEWIYFQTRTLPDKHKIPFVQYSVKKGSGLFAPIYKTEEDSDASVYKCDKLPVTVTLLHTKANPVYGAKGTISSALETYQSIVHLKTDLLE